MASPNKLFEYEFLIKTTLAPLQRTRALELQSAQTHAAHLHQRAEVLAALCTHPGPAPFRPLSDLGLGVSVAVEPVAGEPLLVDVGCGVYLPMVPEEAYNYSRRVAAEARMRHAKADKALQDVSADLASACDALLMLQQLESSGQKGR